MQAREQAGDPGMQLCNPHANHLTIFFFCFLAFLHNMKTDFHLLTLNLNEKPAYMMIYHPIHPSIC